MKEKLLLGCSLLLSISMLPVQVFAEWQHMEPGVVGGELSPNHRAPMIHVAEDQVLMFGGDNGTTYLDQTWLYDISDNRWTKQAPIIGGDLTPRSWMGVATINEDRVLMFGGRITSTSYLDETWLFDLSENQWSQLFPTIIGNDWTIRAGVGMAYLGDDKVLMFGGYYSGIYRNETWIFDLSDNSWTNMTPTVLGGSLTKRLGMSLASIGDGKILGFGGRYTTFYNETWLYELETNTWTKLTPTIIGGSLQGRDSAGLSYAGGDRVLLFGGRVGDSNKGENDLWLYDLSENSWTLIESTGVIPPVRTYHGFTMTGPGKAMAFGGVYNDGTNHYLNDTWIVDLVDYAAASLAATIENGGITLSWGQQAEVAGSTFYLYKNGKRISDAITSGTMNGDLIHFSYFDANIASGTLNRYKLLEENTIMNSKVFSKEITVPYCN